MDWFRWHHGSVTDPKFQLVAKKAGASVAEVVAVWAYVLETASQNPKRGTVGSLDCEAIDLALGMADGKTDTILSVLHDRGVLVEGRIAAWDKRQPKREDETANDRKRRQREREHELSLAAVTGDASRNVTQGHEASRAVTPEEKRGEEKDQEQEREVAALPPSPADADETQAAAKREAEAAAQAEAAAKAAAEAAAQAKADPVCRVVLEAYHRRLPNCQAVHAMPPARRRRILAANKLAKSLIAQKSLGVSLAEFWDGYFAECAEDPWLSGRKPNVRNPEWKQNIDVLLRDEHFGNVMDKALARDLGSPA